MAFKIAITGGPASGKSTVLKRLEKKGLPVFSADEVVYNLTKPGTQIYYQIKSEFGRNYILTNGRLDRKALLRMIIADSRAKERLESILHPAVRDKLFDFFYEYRQAQVIVAEIPLLFELGWERWFDLVIVVYVPEKIQKARLLERLDDKELVEGILRLQWPLIQKCRLADLVVLGGDITKHH